MPSRAWGLALLTAGLASAAPAQEAAEREVAHPRELAEALREAKPGDTIVIADGSWKDARILLDAEGAPGRPVTVRARTPGRLVFCGNSRLEIAGKHLVVDGLLFRDGYAEDAVVSFRGGKGKEAEDCRLTNSAIVDYNPPGRKPESKWVSLYGLRNRVDRCAFTGKTTAGATVVVWVGPQPNGHRIDRNYFGPRPRLGKNGGETLRVGTSDVSMNASRTVVERNLFEDCNGEIEVISSKSCENVYRHNTFVRCKGALTLRHGNRCSVEGNHFLGEGVRDTGGVRVIGEDHRVVNNYFWRLEGDEGRAPLCLMNGIPDSPLSGYFQVKRAVVAFNTFVDCSPLVVGLAGEKPPGGVLAPEACVFANNLVAGSRGPLVVVSTPPRDMTWRGNLFHGAPAGVESPEGVRAADPGLSPGPDGLPRPAAGGPARGSAEGDFSPVREDIEGRPRGDSKDVGCHQVSSPEAPARGPLTRKDVGPAWMRGE